ncbi:MAG: hypothetical protein B0W54_00625 [Cellvibrio sp. 79]|nr:MAG: hypothetical protein B0W54_00625 [Cellvibrio sp. 79]
MENPYAAPVAAPLATTQHLPKKMLWWKILFWLLVILEGAAFIAIVWGDDALAWDDSVEIVIYVFVIAGIFGFAYQRVLFAELFWRGVIPVAALWDIFLIGKSVYEGLHQEYFFVGVVIIAAVFGPVMFFQYLALYKYAFQSPHLWNAKTNRVAPE